MSLIRSCGNDNYSHQYWASLDVSVASEQGSTPRCYLLWLAKRQQVTPNLLRVTLRGEGLGDFPAACSGAHLKLFFPRPGQIEPLLPPFKPETSGPDGGLASSKPVVRTYTVHSCDGQELCIDFVLHKVPGPAVNWARHAQIGSSIGVSLPGAALSWVKPTQWQLIAGDMTALPMIRALLVRLPVEARGAVYISIPSRADQQPLISPPGIDLHWLLETEQEASSWSRAVLALELPDEPLCVTLAGESMALQQTRRRIRQHRHFDPVCCYMVPFWKRASSEEHFQHERHTIMSEVDG